MHDTISNVLQQQVKSWS